MSYDFNQTFTDGFTNTSTGSITFGPKINIGHHAIHRSSR